MKYIKLNEKELSTIYNQPKKTVYEIQRSTLPNKDIISLISDKLQLENETIIKLVSHSRLLENAESDNRYKML
jgi:hypothetical protein